MFKKLAIAALLCLEAGLQAFTNGQAATLVLGQPDFASNAINAGAIGANTLYRSRRFYTDGVKLAIADTDNNRVLLWDSFPTSDFQPADRVLGQADFVSSAANRGGTVAANTLNYPHGIQWDGSRLWVVDMNNNRVLWWNGWPTSNGQAADGVLGQVDLSSNTAACTQTGFYQPAAVFNTGYKLVIGDTYNHRVLIYNTVPSSNGAAADVVVGQTDFTSNTPGCAADKFQYPHHLEVQGGRLVVADTNNHRFLVFNSLPSTNGASAVAAIGQSGLNACSPNAGGSAAANTISWAVGFHIDAAGDIWLADKANSRILRQQPLPLASNSSANLVEGQSSFTASAINQTGLTTTSAVGLNNPYAVQHVGTKLLVMDTENHRLLVYDDPAPTVTPSPLPTACASDLNIPACNWTGLGQPGDLVMTLNGNGMIAGFNRTTNTWYRFSSSLTGIDGICTVFSDPSKVAVVRQDTGQIELFNSSGVSQGVWGSTVAGNKKIGAYDPLDGSFWVPDQSAMTLWRIPAAGGAGTQISVTGSGLNQPTGCAFDENGNLYITNAGDQSILKISAAAATAAGGSGTAVASTLASGFSHSLLGIFYDGNGSLYTAGWAASSPSNTSGLYRVSTSTGAKVLLCSSFGSLAENNGGQLYQTDGVSVDSDGDIWMTQFQNPGSTVGLLKLSSTGTPLAFFKLPATIGGFSTGNMPPDDMAVLGQIEPRPACGVVAATPCAASPTSTATSSPTATQTASPAPSLTATPTATQSASPTATPSASPSATRTATALPPSPTATPSATPTAGGATPVPPTATAVPTHVRRDDERVHCDPNFVRGRGQVMKILVQAFAGGDCSVKVNRANGRVMADLWHGYLQPQETKVQDWDCQDSQGDESPSGVYYVVFTDGDGSIQVQKVLIVR